MEISAEDFIASTEYVGHEISIKDISDYQYLVFYGQNNQDNGQANVCIYDTNDTKAAEYTIVFQDLDNEKHQYLIDVSDLSGNAKIIFNGGCVDNTGSLDSTYTFTNITLH